MIALVPDRLKELWEDVESNRIDEEAFEREQARMLDGLAGRWSDALRLNGCTDLAESLLNEYGAYVGVEETEKVRDLFTAADESLAALWRDAVDPLDRSSVERFYDEAEAQIPELLRWHTLRDDRTPLAYVTALQLAEAHGCRTYLDFGTGPGSGPVLFARNGFDVSLADISSSSLDFCAWRFRLRGLPTPQIIDLKTTSLPEGRFDIVTAMDVFEHLVDPAESAESIWRSLRSGGLFFGRFNRDADDDEPSHIVADFGPMYERMQELGLVKIWEDEWLWGHEAFQKR